MTDLESCVLGVVWQEGPITAYEIARIFASSLSSYWSGSAGAIYPLMRRLEEKGLLAGESAQWNKRKKRTFTITDAGLDELRAWLSPPFDDAVGTTSFDPVRTRLYFLDALAPRARARFLDDAERVIAAQLARLEKLLASERGARKTLDALATRGAIRELQARLEWLSEVRRELLPRG